MNGNVSRRVQLKIVWYFIAWIVRQYDQTVRTGRGWGNEGECLNKQTCFKGILKSTSNFAEFSHLLTNNQASRLPSLDTKRLLLGVLFIVLTEYYAMNGIIIINAINVGETEKKWERERQEWMSDTPVSKCRECVPSARQRQLSDTLLQFKRHYFSLNEWTSSKSLESERCWGGEKASVSGNF